MSSTKDPVNADTSPRKVLNKSTLNPQIVKVRYAVRGPLLIRALEIAKELSQGVKKPFDSVIRCNIGDAQAMGQLPLTYIRQVVAICTYSDCLTENMAFSEDVKNRARRLLSACSGKSIGAYSQSSGIEMIRENVARFIEKRDGFPSKPSDIFLSTGATDAIKSILFALMTGKDGDGRAGVMIPIPQYPLYSATLSEYNAFQIGYLLNEDNAWNVDVSELKRALNEARNECIPRAIVVINPGNPTGNVLTRSNIQDIVKFAYEEHLLILADEVYQHNVYSPESEFHSFKKVMNEMGAPYDGMELASFFSVSKGYMGECGFRGGYCETTNFDVPHVLDPLSKLLSARLCPPVTSQIIMDLIVNPPLPGEESFDQYEREKAQVLGDLKKKAKLVSEALNGLEGMTCNEIQGAMYAFPRLHLPVKAITAAEQCGQQPDVFYCTQLLEEAGICVIPGSGFGQKDGTYHFRTTILPQLKDMDEVLGRFRNFQARFMDKYR